MGEVGRCLADALAQRGLTDITVYDVAFNNPDSKPARNAAAAAVTMATTHAEAALGADLIISAVTAGSAVAVANACCEGLSPGAWFFDLNSAAPATKQKAARVIERAGGRYVEASIMAPIYPKGIAAPILLGGPFAQTFEEGARSLGFVGATFYCREVGKAAAAKLCRSIMTKGVEALILESLTAAAHYGVHEDVIQSLHNLLPHPDWTAHAQYMTSPALEHGTRRAEEMRQAANMASDAGLDPWMANAIGARQSQAGALVSPYTEGGFDLPLAEILKRLSDELASTEERRGV